MQVNPIPEGQDQIGFDEPLPPVPVYKKWEDPVKKTIAFEQLDKMFEERIVLIDGAMGTNIQDYKLDENDYRGERYKDATHEMKGNNDILVITKPDLIAEIHTSFMEAGADIIETNTFNGTTISMFDYGLDTIDEVHPAGPACDSAADCLAVD